MTAQHRMTKAHPLACNCKPGWVSSDANPPTPSLAIARWGGFFVVYFSPPPCMQLQAGVGFFLPMRAHPPPHLQLRDGVGFFHLFFKSMNDDDNEPCRLVADSLCMYYYNNKYYVLHVWL